MATEVFISTETFTNYLAILVESLDKLCRLSPEIFIILYNDVTTSLVYIFLKYLVNEMRYREAENAMIVYYYV